MPPWEKYASQAAPGGPVYGVPPKPDKPPAPDKPNLPVGYRMGPNGAAERIPGLPPEKGDESDTQAYSQSAIDAFDRAISSAGRLKKHPGFGAAVGSGLDPQSWGSYVPWSDEPFAGTNAADFNAELAAMKAQVFLPMVQSMKGMGALSNAEGQKLTDAIGALDPNMSEGAFASSLQRIIGDLTVYRDRGRPPQGGGNKAPRVIRYDAQGKRLP